MHITDEQLRALSESERFLRRMSGWALPPEVRGELDHLLAAYGDLSRQADPVGRAATVPPAAPVAGLAELRAPVLGERPFPGNLKERLPEWTASVPDGCPPTPFDITEALERIKVVGCETSWRWFDYARENELGGLQPAGAIEFFDGAEALRHMLWRMSNPRWNGGEPVRRVAFLGIDGVLYPQPRRPPNSFESLKRRVEGNAAIEKLEDCLSAGGLDVVVHSHWRTRLTRVQLLDLLSMEDGGFGGTSGCACCSSGSFLVGTTLSTLDGASGIRDAVARMRLGDDDYVVIDTDADLLADVAGQALRCDGSRGIDEAFVDALCERVSIGNPLAFRRNGQE
ncbi:HAD domain-containing protein [Roseateles sp. BYS78W]|uniref:HAD domain-containing protein n=1 Tax=Pelomonas candidula TaxID=3299025 RepID=A0ABW7HEG5_9BURK